MKKIILSFVLLSTTVISGYFIFIWSPKSITTDLKISEENNKVNLEKNNVNMKEESEKYKTVMKDAGKTINESLSYEDKNKIYKYIDKFSAIDVALIEEYMENNKDYNAIKGMVRIFKERLNYTEYKEVKDILSKYINVDIIEKETT